MLKSFAEWCNGNESLLDIKNKTSRVLLELQDIRELIKAAETLQDWDRFYTEITRYGYKSEELFALHIQANSVKMGLAAEYVEIRKNG